MSKRVAIIGAGTIGASWAACFLARGCEVAAYDPAPNGEAFARRFIDNAWATLDTLGVVAAGADKSRISFFKTPSEAAKGAQFVQESGPSARMPRSTYSRRSAPSRPPTPSSPRARPAY